ncbi:hypothetical protein MNBD_GAMMA07-720 [hydrothermal vent metagenome]|uniref:SHOCT domain-containing protein n=1 Tax=hydrothermal vent metagenome TaxID=652676 RepID=A0A3B0X3V4_9ZZZZ
MFEHNGMMFFGGGLMWIFWIVLIVGIIFIVKKLSTTDKKSKYQDIKKPFEILKERYARGEIDKSEFEQKRNDLKS